MTVETSPFSEVFGPKSSRKRVKLSVSNIDELAGDSVKSLETYHEKLEEQRLLSGEIGAAQAEANEAAGDMARDSEAIVTTAVEPIFSKGQSKRIWNELCTSLFLIRPKQTKLTKSADKVMDSSDVILHILDARDPLGTRCRSVEKYLKEEAPHKHLVFVLNKCDLVPTKVAVSFNYPDAFLLQPPRFSQDTFRRVCVSWNLAVTFWGEEYPIPESLVSTGEDRWRPFWLKSWDWSCHHLS